jgi:LysM repeat protein
VPVANAETFRARLNDPDAKLVSWRTHRLKRGENFAAVASQFGMSSDELKKVNGISANRRIAGGGAILVRDAHADEGDLDAAAPLEAETPPPMETITFSHRVKRGESLASIARRYNISIGSLRTWNRISPTQGAHVGQLLVMHRSAEMGEPSLKEGLSEASIISSSSPINSVPASSATHSAPAKPAVKAPPTTRVKQLAPSKKPVVAAKTVKASPSPQTKKSNN